MKKINISLIVIGIWILTSGVVCAQQQRVLRVSQALTEPATLDPHMHHNVETEDITRQIFEHLIERDPDGKLIPSLATGWQLINENTWQTSHAYSLSGLTASTTYYYVVKVSDKANNSATTTERSFVTLTN